MVIKTSAQLFDFWPVFRKLYQQWLDSYSSLSRVRKLWPSALILEIKFYWNSIMPIYILPMAGFGMQQQRWAVATMTYDLQRLKCLLSGPLRKCCRTMSMIIIIGLYKKPRFCGGIFPYSTGSVLTISHLVSNYLDKSISIRYYPMQEAFPNH